jgi:hypothetical protein
LDDDPAVLIRKLNELRFRGRKDREANIPHGNEQGEYSGQSNQSVELRPQEEVSIKHA